MRRVLIIGCSGAGKSTFARVLAGRTGLPLIHLDKEFWHSGWTETPRAAWRAKVAALAAGGDWIMDGAFEGSLDLRLPRADTVVWFDQPRHVCLRRVLQRVAANYGRVRSDIAAGCPERFDLTFVRWIWTYNRIERPRIEAMLGLHGAHLSPVMIRRDRDARSFLDAIVPRSREP